jgi:hypothetical protein
MVIKKRHAFGSKNGMSILTEERVLEIKKAYTGKRGQIAALARQYGVSETLVRRIVKGYAWTHVCPSSPTVTCEPEGVPTAA